MNPVGARFIVRTADLSAKRATRADKSAMATINRRPTTINQEKTHERR
jgi:hypothetical protein